MMVRVINGRMEGRWKRIIGDQGRTPVFGNDTGAVSEGQYIFETVAIIVIFSV